VTFGPRQGKEMLERIIQGDCQSCESSFEVIYVDTLTSSDVPEFCPFCGEVIDNIQEEYIEDDSYDENDGEWED
jgi:hypothetical protein